MNAKKKYSFFLAGLIVFIFILHSLALYFSLYWRFRWLDNVMHFLGGFWLGAAALWFICFSGKIKSSGLPFYFLLFSAVALSAVVGLVWEFYEFLSDFFLAGGFPPDPSMLGLKDTLTDLFFDLLGALAAGLIFTGKLSKHENGG